MKNEETEEQYRARVDAENAAIAKDIDHQLGPDGWIAKRGDPYYGYYISFGETGVPEIDLILKCIAAAGKGYHNIEGWNDRREDTEASYVDLIQEAANRAAKAMKSAPAPGPAPDGEL
jgi:hypothetical protein